VADEGSPDVRLLLTILSVVVSWSLLGVLVTSLLRIQRALERVGESMRKIAMGVQAIDDQTRPLGPGANALAASVGETGETLSLGARHLTELTRDLDGLVPLLRARSR